MEIFSKFHSHYKHTYLLESIEGPRKLAQFSFIGFDPQFIVTVKDGEVTIRNERTCRQSIEVTDNPLGVIQEHLKRKAFQNREFRLLGGAVGYFSYEAVHYWEKPVGRDKSGPDFPDAEFGFFEDGIIFDHRRKRMLYYFQNESRLQEIKEAMELPVRTSFLAYTQPRANITRKQFMVAVGKAKTYVTKGDVFQVVLSKRYAFEIEGDLIGFYQTLRQINPSPYMYFLKMGDRQIVGASPEMLVRVDNRVVETFPIAGTRPFTGNPYKDKLLAKELLADPKERAEHVMLVDLARNDLGKIATFGSVRVTEFMKVHRYSHVQHIVSRVEGKLREDCVSLDALRAVFPAGTVTGAPKVRAMEIIDELERRGRGPYAGAVGYFSYNGNADFAITIRTLFADKNKAYIQAGAGIVADSVPEREWLETEHKTEALMKALAASGGKKH